MEDIMIQINGDSQDVGNKNKIEESETNEDFSYEAEPLIADGSMTPSEIKRLDSENWVIVNDNALQVNAHNSAMGRLKSKMMSSMKQDKANVEIMDEPAHEEITEEVANKVFESIEHFIGGCVQSMNEKTVDKYIGFIKENYPIDEEVWDSIKLQMIEACNKGPKVRIQCHEGRIPGYYNKDKIQLVAFFKSDEDKEIHAMATSSDDDLFQFNFDESLLLVGAPSDTLRIELRIVSAGTLVKRTLIGFVEKKIEDIPNVQDEEKYPIMKSDKGLLALEDIEELSDGYLKLQLTKDESEVHANVSVPRILKDHFCHKAIQVFDLPEDSNRASKNPKTHFQVHVCQKDTKGTMRSSTPYQILHSQNDFTKSSDVMCTFPLCCILTDHLEFGKEKYQSSPSPSPRNSTMFDLGSPMLNSLLSVSSNTGSPYSDNSFNKSPNASIGKKLGDSIGKMFGNSVQGFTSSTKTLGETFFSPGNMNHFKVDVDRILPLGSERTYRLESKSLAWDTTIKENNPSSMAFEENDILDLYVKAIVKTSQKEGKEWDGKLDHSIYSVLKIVEEFSRIDPMVLLTIKAKAFIKAHSVSHINNKILWLHILTLENDKSSSTTSLLKKYENYALDYLANHRSHHQDKYLPDVIENLKILLKSDSELVDRIKEAVHHQTTQLYHMWEREVKKEVYPEGETQVKGCASVTGSCGLFEHITKQREAIEMEVTNNFEVCSKMMNLHVLPDLQVGCTETGIHKAFEGIFNYQEYIAHVYIEEAKKIIKMEYSARHHPLTNSPGLILGLGGEDDVKLLLHEGHDDSSMMNADQASYNCFMALKRIFKYFHISDQESWLFQHFKRYPTIWMGFAIKKASKQIHNLIVSIENHSDFSIQSSETDSVLHVLQNVYGIANQVWKFWHKLNEEWPDVEVNLQTGFILIEGLSLLDTNIIKAVHDIHMQDKDYESQELASTIRMLDGLKKKQNEAVKELEVLNTGTQNKKKLEKTLSQQDAMSQNEQNNQHLSDCYELIKNATEMIDEEIQNKMNLYCTHYAKSKIRNYLKNKNIHAVDEMGGFTDCLLYFIIEQEMKLLHNHIRMDEYCKGEKGVNQMLWNTMEKEIINHFEEKNERNKQLNKPTRFQHIKVAMNHLIDAKKGLSAANIIASSDLSALQKVKEELQILTADTVDLVKKCLKVKIKEQQNNLQKDDRKSKHHAVLKVGIFKDSKMVKIEPVSLNGLTPRPGKSYSKIQLYVHPFPRSDGKDHTIESPIFPNVEDAIAFDLAKVEHKNYEFSLEGQDEIFITITVFDINKLGFKHFVAEMVVQVNTEDIAELDSAKDFVSQASSVGGYLSSEYCQLYATEEYAELTNRWNHDQVARHFIRKEEELRSYANTKKPFLSFRH